MTLDDPELTLTCILPPLSWRLVTSNKLLVYQVSLLLNFLESMHKFPNDRMVHHLQF